MWTKYPFTEYVELRLNPSADSDTASMLAARKKGSNLGFGVGILIVDEATQGQQQ